MDKELFTSYEYDEVNKNKEESLLDKVCADTGINIKTVVQLINLEKSMIGKRRRRGLQNQIDMIIQSTIMSKEMGEENAIKESDI